MKFLSLSSLAFFSFIVMLLAPMNSHALGLQTGCFQGKIKQTSKHTLLSGGKTTIITLSISKSGKARYQIREDAPDVDFGDSTGVNPTTHITQYVATNIKGQSYFYGQQDLVRLTFSESGTPRVKLTKLPSNKLDYRRTIRWYIGDSTFDFADTAKGTLSKVSSSNCASF